MDDHLKNKYSSAAVVLVDLFSSPTGRIKRVDSGKEYRSAPNLKETDGPGGSLEGARQKAGEILWETHMHMDLSTLIFQRRPNYQSEHNQKICKANNLN
jgi:hypothetical protein